VCELLLGGEDAVRMLPRGVLTDSRLKAADLLAGPSRPTVLNVEDVEVDPAPEHWLDHQALWVKRRIGSKPLSQCVDRSLGTEPSGDQLVGVAELAHLAGIGASTLRAYISCGDEDVPPCR
jgi:hypothetical protein